MLKKTFVTIFVLTLGSFAFAQNTAVKPFERRANDIVTIVNEPKDLEKYFSKEFLGQIAPEQISEISKQLLTTYGKALNVERIKKESDLSGEVSVLFEKKFVGKFRLIIKPDGENLIDTLVITGFEAKAESLQNIVDELMQFSGKTSFVAARLGGNEGKNIIEHNPNEQLAIGSTFKLYVLAELVRQISEGKRKWSDVVLLTEASLPSGQMQKWEAGSPVTLHTLASMMISISDNTATDQLIKTLGRENIERMLKPAGNANPERSIPFLTTAEMFKLKGLANLEFAKKYVPASQSAKRGLLANEIANASVKDIKLDAFLAEPTYIAELEWFASGNDLVRLMNWLRVSSDNVPLDKARGVMTISKALPPETAKMWKYVGYKGGSEPGVISMTYLLQSDKGEWFVVTASWNDEKKVVDENKFATLVQSAVKILAGQTK